MVFQHFCFSSLFALETVSGPTLGRFWSPKSTQNRSRIGLHSWWKSWSFFNAFLSFKKSIFGPTWPQHGPILAPKMTSSWPQNGVKTDPKTVSEARSAPEPILGRVWVDFGPMLGRLWPDFGRFWDDVWSILGCSSRTCGVLACFSDTSLAFAWCSLGILRTCQVPTFIQMLTEWSKDAPTERAKRAECVRTAYLLLTYYLLNLRGMCVFFRYMLCTRMVCAWYFYLRVPTFTQMLPNFSRDAPTERAKRAEYVRITHLLFT